MAARTGPGVLWWGKTTPCVSVSLLPPCPCVAVSATSRPAERCRRMCQEPGLELGGGCLLTAHRRIVVYSA
eukprot:3846162-Prymnesium_polylepis.1